MTTILKTHHKQTNKQTNHNLPYTFQFDQRGDWCARHVHFHSSTTWVWLPFLFKYPSQSYSQQSDTHPSIHPSFLTTIRYIIIFFLFSPTVYSKSSDYYPKKTNPNNPYIHFHLQFIRFHFCTWKKKNTNVSMSSSQEIIIIICSHNGLTTIQTIQSTIIINIILYIIIIIFIFTDSVF